MLVHPAGGIRAWEAASLLADEVRAEARRIPYGARYGLVDQLVRAADAISANIAEGSGRKTVPDRLTFFHTALSSARETLTHLTRCFKAKLFNLRTYRRLTNRARVTHSMLAALIRTLER